MVRRRYYFTSFREWEEEKHKDLINKVIRLVGSVKIKELNIGLSLVLFNPAYIIS
jgi:hypothetical protein